MHTATLFIDEGAASGRGWWVNCADDDCVYAGLKSDEYMEVEKAVLAIYDAVPWPYPKGIWPTGTFTAAELRDHLERFMASR